MTRLLTALLLLSLASCSPKTRFAILGAKNPQAAAVFCADRFPSRDSFSVVKEYIRGEEVVRVDTVTVDCGEVANVGGGVLSGKGGVLVQGGGAIVRVPCPPCITRVDTVKLSEFERQLNRAAVQVERDRSDKAEKAEVKQRTQKRIAIWAAAIGWGLIVITVLIRIFKPKLL